MKDEQRRIWIGYLEHQESELAANWRLFLVISLSAIAVFWGIARSDNPFRNHALLAGAIALVISLTFLSSAHTVRQHTKRMLFPEGSTRYHFAGLKKEKERLYKEIRSNGILTATITILILTVSFILFRYLT